jgi:hypothetical protein
VTKDQLLIERTVAALGRRCGQFGVYKQSLLICNRSHGHPGICRLSAESFCYEWWGYSERAPEDEKSKIWMCVNDTRELLSNDLMK